MLDEQALVRRCVEGDEGAFAELVDRYKLLVFNIAARMVNDQSLTEDLAQEVFLRVYRGLPAFRGRAKLSTWIYRIAYRVCLEELERPQHCQTYFSLEDTGSFGRRSRSVAVSEADRAFGQVEAQEDLSRWMSRLPPNYRMVLTLYYLQDRNYREVAEIMEIPLGTVKTYLHRAKGFLKACMLKERVRI